MKIVFLDAKTMGDIPNLKKAETFGELIIYQTTTAEQVLERIKDCDIAISNKVKIRKEVMEQCPNLKLICVAATGTDNIDVAFAEDQGILVKNAKDYSTHSVAQLTFTLILGLLCQIRFYDDFVKSGNYSQSDIFTSTDRPFWQLHGKQMGIVGLGNIGRQVAKIAEGFGMEITYYSSSGKDRHPEHQRLELDELLKTSDVVSVHSPMNEKTKNLITYEQLKLMKPTALLINTSRGGIVKEADLAKAIDEELIRGAGVDAYEQEPLPADHPYLAVKNKDNMILTPHTAWTSLEARTLLMDIVCDNIQGFVEKGV